MKKRIIPLVLCLLLILGGCSSITNQFSQAPQTDREDSLTGSYGAANYSANSPLDEEAAKAELQDPSDDDASSPETDDQIDAGADAAKDKQKLVYTCDMVIETLEFDDTLKSVKETVTKYSGITEREDQTDKDTYWYNNYNRHSATKNIFMVIRIPAANYQSFLDELEGNGKVISKNMQVENITKKYSEIQTTIKSLQIQEKRLLDMMEKAGSVEDMITVESRLTEVQNDLARYKNTLASLDTDVNYSTINLTINEVVKYEEKQETFTERLHSTLERSGELFLSFLEGALFALILFGPILLVLLILILIIVKIVKTVRRSRKQKAIRKKTEKAAQMRRPEPEEEVRSEESPEVPAAPENQEE